MKVAFFLNDFPEVSDIFIFNQIIALIQRKHEIDIYARRIIEPNGGRHADIEHYHLLDRTYCWSVPRRPFERLAGAAARLVRWGWRNPKITLDSLNVLRHRRSALNLRTLYELLPPFEIPRQYDVIHCHYGPNGQTAVAWRDFGALRGPVITTFHGYDVNKLPRVYGSNLYKRLFNEGELFTVGSEFIKKRIITLGAPKDRVVELPMGVDLSRFRFTARIQNCDGELQLVTVARLVEVKGIEYAVTAVAKLKDKYPRLQYKIVGDGPLRAELESLSIQYGLANNIQFLGAMSQEQIVELYQSAQIFLLPSIVTNSGEEENQSVALAEAQASGLPVIATRIGGNPESIREGESGLLVPPRDASALASAIQQLAEHPHAWGQMGRAGRRHVEQQFNLELLNNRLIDLYRMVAPNNCW